VSTPRAPSPGRRIRRTHPAAWIIIGVIVLVVAVVSVVNRGSSPGHVNSGANTAPAEQAFPTGVTPGSGLRVDFCRHLEVSLVQTMNVIGDQSTTGQEAIASLESDRQAFVHDEQSSDPQVASYARGLVGGIDAYVAAIRQYGLTAATDSHFSNTISDPMTAPPSDFCQ
jgi:hypothetical protein